jgi:hypothetical protein
MAGKKRCFVTVRAPKRLDENLLCEIIWSSEAIYERWVWSFPRLRTGKTWIADSSMLLATAGHSPEDPWRSPFQEYRMRTPIVM